MTAEPGRIVGRLGQGQVPSPPPDLSTAAAQLWTDTVSSLVFSGPELALLESALRALDRAEDARKIVDKEGATYTSDSGVVHKHPATSVELESRREFRICWSRLGLLDTGGA